MTVEELRSVKAMLLLLCWSIDPAVPHSRLAVASLP
jgi:hypothetical protein